MLDEGQNESEESPKFARLSRFLKIATLKAMVPTTSLGPNPDNSLVERPLLEEEEHLFQFLDKKNMLNNDKLINFPPQLRPNRPFNPAVEYNLSYDLCSLRANISIVELIQIASALRNAFKGETT